MGNGIRISAFPVWITGNRGMADCCRYRHFYLTLTKEPDKYLSGQDVFRGKQWKS